MLEVEGEAWRVQVGLELDGRSSDAGEDYGFAVRRDALARPHAGRVLESDDFRRRLIEAEADAVDDETWHDDSLFIAESSKCLGLSGARDEAGQSYAS